MKHFKPAAKAVSLLLAAVLLLALPSATALAAELYEPSAAAVTQIIVRNDATGKDISSEPEIFLDNSDIAGGQCSATITVSLADAYGSTNVSGDSITYALSNSTGSARVEDITPDGVTSSKTLRLYGYDGSDSLRSPRKPGTTTISFTNTDMSNRVDKTVKCTVLAPASDMEVFWNGSSEPLTLNDLSIDNSDSVTAVTEHSYKLTANVLPSESTDKVIWNVYEGSYSGQGTASPTTKATVTEDGVFNALREGEVTIEARFAGTSSSQRLYSYGTKKVEENGSLTERTVQTIPKYIHVKIVKVNPAAKITFKDVPSVIGVGETYQTLAEVTPSYTGSGYSSTTDELTWTSSDESVVQISSDGLLKGVGKGSAVITLYAENNSIYAEQNVKVIRRPTGITIAPTPAETRVSVPIELRAVMTPSDASDDIVWSLSDNNVAKLSVQPSSEQSSVQTALLTGLSEGTVMVTATAYATGVSETISIKVDPRIESDGLSLEYEKDESTYSVYNGVTVDLYTGQEINIKSNLTSLDGSTPDDTIEWEVTNSNDCLTVVSQSGEGITLHGSSPGTATVKAFSSTDHSVAKTFYVQVLRACDYINFCKPDMETTIPSTKSMNVGSFTMMRAKLTIDGNYPSQHSDSVVSWESSDPAVAQVDQNGNVRAIANGEAYITVKTASGQTASQYIYVYTTSEVIMEYVTASDDGSLPTTDIGIDKEKNGTKKLGVTVKDGLGNSVSNTDVQWSSSNESVAKVNNEGVVTAVDLGETIITVTSGNKSDQCRVWVWTYMRYVTIEDIEPQVYSPVKTVYEPKPKVIFGDKELVENVDYSLSYENNTSVGSASVTLTGMGDFWGEEMVYFSIVPKPITDPEIAYMEIPEYDYTGFSITPIPELTCSFILMTEETDYTYSYYDNVVPGTGKIVVRGTGNYTGTIEIPFHIHCDHQFEKPPAVVKEATCAEPGIKQGYCTVCKQTVDIEIPSLPHTFGGAVTVAPTTSTEGYDLHTCEVCGFSYKDNYVDKLPGIKISECSATISGMNFPYKGEPITPTVTITHGGKTLVEGTDYTITYLNNTSVGTGYILITGAGEYSGMGKITFHITNGVSDADTDAPKDVTIEMTDIEVENDTNDGRISIANDEPQILNSVTYSPLLAPYEPKPSASADGIALIENVDYIITYTNNDRIGTATISMTGIGKYKGTARFQFDILPRSMRDGTIIFRAIDTQKCTGQPLTPQPIVIFSNVILSSTTDYTVTYKNNTQPGMATATITGIGNYTDSIDLNFDIECDHDYEDTYVPGSGSNPGYTLHTCRICGDTYKDNEKSKMILGDVNDDGVVAADDALMTLRHTVGLTVLNRSQISAADVDFDNTVTANDSLSILRYTIGMASADTPIGKSSSAVS